MRRLFTTLASKCRIIALLIRGFSIDRTSYIETGVSIAAESGKQKALEIGKHGILRKNCEIRIAKDARILIGNNVLIDRDVRIVVANQATVRIEDGVRIGKGTVINAGDNCNIGRGTLISGYCYIQCSSHNISASRAIREQGHSHAAIKIGSDCLIGAFSFIEKGTVIRDGAVCGSHSYIRGRIAEYSIMIGRPVKEIGKRS